MTAHNADLHALRHEVDRLNNLLKERDLEIAALKATQARTERIDPVAIVEHQQNEYEGGQASADEGGPREDFTKASDVIPPLPETAKSHDKHKSAK